MEQPSDINPYAPPQSQRLANDTPESLRRAMIRHESEIKGVGLLYGIIGGLMLLPVLIQSGERLSGQMLFGSFRQTSWTAFLPALLISLAALFLGSGLRRVSSWGRFPVVIISVLLGAYSFFTLIGPAVNAYIVWLMLSPKGGIVMSPRYQRILDLTPDVKPRTSIISVFLILMLVLGIIAVLAALLIPAWSRLR